MLVLVLVLVLVLSEVVKTPNTSVDYNYLCLENWTSQSIFGLQNARSFKWKGIGGSTLTVEVDVELALVVPLESIIEASKQYCSVQSSSRLWHHGCVDNGPLHCQRAWRIKYRVPARPRFGSVRGQLLVPGGVRAQNTSEGFRRHP